MGPEQKITDHVEQRLLTLSDKDKLHVLEWAYYRDYLTQKIDCDIFGIFRADHRWNIYRFDEKPIALVELVDHPELLEYIKKKVAVNIPQEVLSLDRYNEIIQKDFQHVAQYSLALGRRMALKEDGQYGWSIEHARAYALLCANDFSADVNKKAEEIGRLFDTSCINGQNKTNRSRYQASYGN